MRYLLLMIFVCIGLSAYSWSKTGMSCSPLDRKGPTIGGVFLLEGCQHAPNHPHDVETEDRRLHGFVQLTGSVGR
jgi:hypothetical protein